MVAGHNHFNAFGKLDRTGNVRGSDEELRSIVVEECGMTAAFILGQNINMKVVVIKPVAIEEGLRFAIREGGRTVGSGVIAKILK